MRTVALRSGSWQSGPVLHAETFLERRRGLKDQPQGTSVLIETKSVHGIGVSRPFRAVGLTSDLDVRGAKLVKPWRIVSFPGCRFVLELPVDASVPDTGSRLELTHV